MGTRNCSRCGIRLARDNATRLCGGCQQKNRDVLFEPPEVPASFWETGPVRAALAARHMGQVVKAFRTHPWHGKPISQTTVARWLYLTQSQLSRIESGAPVQDMGRLMEWAHTLRIPSDLLWFALPDGGSEDEAVTAQAVPVDDWQSVSELLRRSFLKRGLAAVALPAVGLDDLKHIVAALDDARRYADHQVIGYLQAQLADCAARDGQRGPKQNIPIVLGLIAAIEQIACDVKLDLRRPLLRVGAQTAEFAGWLYRDIAMPELAHYWHDRATEWAQASNDLPMQGYVLLKKSQAAWDERDALRMLTLAEATQEGPWQLPARVQAEAAQQAARGHAMLSGNLDTIESELGKARALLAEDTPSTETAAHYDRALFDLQCAICYTEAGEPARALELYEERLSPETFSRRDYGYFLSLKGSALVMAQAPDQAACTGREALTLARETNSARTFHEVMRLVEGLRPWGSRDSVRELTRAVLA